jgi:hypothetical protein
MWLVVGVDSYRMKDMDNLIKDLCNNKSDDHNQQKDEEREDMFLANLCFHTVRTVSSAE